MDEYLEGNRRLWNEWTHINAASEFYDVERFRAGGIRLRPFEIEEVGDVSGKDLLHLQCHFGLDTLSWARLGATVTGADFSEEAVNLARSLAAELDLPARFVCSNLYDLPQHLEGDFDVVYTSRGVLGWLPDLDGWARVAAGFLRPGGLFYITEIHPVAQVFDDEAADLRLRYPYFSRPVPIAFEVQGSYADRSAHVEQAVEYGWNHGLGEIITALADAGLRIEFVHEMPFVDWEVSFLSKDDGGRLWRLDPDSEGELPLSFSLKAVRPLSGD